MVATHLLADAITLIARIPMRQRSSYPKTFKAQVAQECRQPVGHSFRRRHGVAISHGINANVIRKWLPIYLDRPRPAGIRAGTR